MPVGRCVVCDIIYLTLGIPEQFSFFTVFIALWFVKFFSGHRSFNDEFSFTYVLHDCVYGVLFVFLVPNASNCLADDSELKRTAFLHFAWSLLQISLEQHDGAPSLIYCGKHFGFHMHPISISWTG